VHFIRGRHCGGDSPTRLIRFPGELAMPGGKPLFHSVVLNEFELLVAMDGIETASSRGEVIGVSAESREEGLIFLGN
jgi:hypothetical protein